MHSYDKPGELTLPYTVCHLHASAKILANIRNVMFGRWGDHLPRIQNIKLDAMLHPIYYFQHHNIGR